jgi:hypothetical protein
MIKARNTEYGGILYRSDLEARWAQFFDSIEIRHKYEWLRIDLVIDTYTPDFWLPDFRLWVEIKPFRQYRPHSKCYRLAIEKGFPVLLIQGYPVDYVIDIFAPNARRKFVHRTVVSEAEIKPSKERFRFQDPGADKNALILVNPATAETLRFDRQCGRAPRF